MTQIVSSISGIEIYAPSAGNAPTNSADVSAIASAYQVVSATATQLYAGTAYVTSINSAPLSASRAGNAANASMANSAYYDGTGRLISSLPDSATVSSIASAYATAKVDKSSISAQSSNWNSVYNTVSNNSASWSGSTGGGGDVASPSGTIVVMNGNEIEGTNSAALTASGEGFEVLLYAQTQHLGGSMQILTYGNVPDTGATLIMPLNNPAYRDMRVILSGQGDYGYVSASGIITSGALTASIPMDGITFNISASADDWFDLTNAQLTAKKDGGILVTGIGELAWQSAVDNVTTTVASNSATWAQGLKYGDKVSNGSNTIGLGKSANTNTDAGIYLSSTHGSGFYKVNEMTLNRTGYGETVNFNLGSAGSQVRVSASGSRGGYFSAWNDNTSAALMVSGSKPVLKLGAELVTDSSVSSWNDCYDTVSANSATWGGGGVDSATVSAIASAYGYSALSSIYAGPGISYGGADDPIIGINYDGAGPLGTNDNNVLICKTDGTTIGVNAAGELESLVGGGVDSATVSAIASGYAESAVSSKADSSSLSSYALSADVSSTVDVVSTQSANWGGSALALSAGPGVKLEKVGNTLVVGVDETVLYSATAYAPGDSQQSYSLNETPLNFETVRVLAYRPLGNGAPWFGSVDVQIGNLYSYTAANTSIAMPYAFVSTANNIFYEGQYFINDITSTSWEDGSSTQRKTTETAYTTGYYAHIYKIIGINRTAGV